MWLLRLLMRFGGPTGQDKGLRESATYGPAAPDRFDWRRLRFVPKDKYVVLGNRGRGLGVATFVGAET